MDPSCPGIVEVRRKHSKRQSLVSATMQTNPELRQRFLGEEAADLGAHLAQCNRCDKFQVANRCPVCGNGLIPEIEGPTCSSTVHRLRVTFGWYDKTKTHVPAPKAPAPALAPAAAPAAPAPPPQAAPREAARAPPEPSSQEPIPAGAQPTTAPPPQAKPKPAPRKKPTPTTAAAPPPPPRPPRRRPSRPQGKPVHDVLGVAADADESTVRSAFREKAKSYHPDRVAHLAPEFQEVAEKHMRELNAAYDEAMKHFARKAKKAD